MSTGCAYPAYLRRGWQSGSGAVESACETVVNRRLCQGGMRWGAAGSDAVAHLRALYRSDPDQWDAFWGQAASKTAYLFDAYPLPVTPLESRL